VPKGAVPEALFWDTASPYHYLRLDARPRGDYVIFGGADHKTGQQADPNKCYAHLKKLLASIVPAAKVQDRWSGQVVETHDGLPLIGETAPHQFVATGFAGNGMTFGTLSAMMAVDALQGRKNPWRELFDVNRKKLSALWDYIKENFDYPYYYVKDKLLSAEGRSLSSLKRGEGKILQFDGQRIAAYRDDSGKVAHLSPNCTHMGCVVRWNRAEATWDCPCHGSRFRPTGEVLAGPAEKPLDPTSENGK
jgi:Rieske Fe-S protein